MNASVLRLQDLKTKQLTQLLEQYQISLCHVNPGQAIPGSFWGDEEAGLVGNKIYARSDTPIHSILHESCHYICLDDSRREQLDTNAGGDYDEENAVCYLQILLADKLAEMGKNRILEDMDRWGYSFRLGSARAWFESDATDARDWLICKKIINAENKPSFRLNH